MYRIPENSNNKNYQSHIYVAYVGHRYWPNGGRLGNELQRTKHVAPSQFVDIEANRLRKIA